MPSTSQSSGITKTGRASAQPDDGVSDLMADHRAVEKLFKQFEEAGEGEKQKIALQICRELTIHAQLEEETIYPMSREFLDDEEIVNEAIVEHASAKELIAQIEGMQASDEMFDAKVKVLQEMIEHHVEEEETQYFPQLRRSDMDLKAMGEQMKARRAELMGGMDGSGGRRTN
jgi:hemerythrin superfamily protein